MRAWRFDDATALLDDATEVLTRRAAIESTASSAGLTPPSTLRDAFQDDDGFADALDEATAESAAMTRYEAAAAAKPVAPDLVVQVGLWGATPELDLADASTAFTAGDLGGAAASADSARSVWASAIDVGRGRLVSAAALGLAIAVALVLLMLSVRGRRRGRRHAAFAPVSRPLPARRMMARPMTPPEARQAADPGVEVAHPYATLAATPGEPPNVAAHDESESGAGSG
jgi:hypothetical protein